MRTDADIEGLRRQILEEMDLTRELGDEEVCQLILLFR